MITKELLGIMFLVFVIVYASECHRLRVKLRNVDVHCGAKTKNSFAFCRTHNAYFQF